MQCPICKKPVADDGADRPKTFPFCSERCKLIDLGRWLGEKYQITSHDNRDTDDPGSLPPPKLNR